MTESTIPTGRPRLVLSQISSVAWEHPADRAALQALRAVPGFDEAVRKIVGFLGERGIRLLFQANAVRVGPTQFPVLHTLLTEVCTTFDWPDQPELYRLTDPAGECRGGRYGSPIHRAQLGRRLAARC